MDQKLRNVIKLITEKENLSLAEFNIASKDLDVDVMLVLKEQFVNGLTMSVGPWM